jgi:Tol biopolymer transport system component
MALVPGTRLGHYEVVAPLGAGGMGEVYSARDTRLDRTVAVKLLPPQVAQDPDRLARFEREAKLLGSLSHPNIATLYGLEEAEGQRVLVMERVEGEDLGRRLKRGAMPVGETLEVARQVAEALEAAHDRGIVHRDLKPANVMLTPEGRAKVLDFGLAKAWAGDADGTASGDFSHSPTLANTGTLAGLILGTAAYLSPEQASGRPVDRRTDVWAFGALVFEMLTGRPVFSGETASEVVAAVLKEEPDWSRLPRDLPPGVGRLLRRCLRKKPRERTHDMGDVRLEIEEALAGGGGSADGTAPHARRVPWAWLAAVAAIAALAAVVAGTLAVRPRPDPRVLAFEVREPEGAGFALGMGPPVLSPDGRMLAFVARTGGHASLYVRPLDVTTARTLPGTDGAQYPFWSPDSRSLGFFADGKLQKIGVAGGGGPPVALCTAKDVKGASWSPKGDIVFAPDAKVGLSRVSDQGGATQPVTQLDAARKENSHRHPRFLPDGRHFLYLARLDDTGEHAVMVGSLEGRPPRELMRSLAAAEFASDHLFFLKDRTLMARPFDVERLEFCGEAFPLVQEVTLVGGGSEGPAFAIFSASPAGILAYHTRRSLRRRLAWHDAEGRETGSLAQEGDYSDVRLSPRGDLALLTIRTFRDDGKIASDQWIVDLTRNVRSRLTALAPGGDAWGGVWERDGKGVVFACDLDGKGHFDLCRQGLSDSAPEMLLKSTAQKQPEDFSPDGRWLLFTAWEDPEESGDLWLLPLEGPREPRPWLKTLFAEASGTFSPDGRYVAYTSDESGREEVYVTPFPGPGRKWRVSADGGGAPDWQGDGKRLFYRSADMVQAVEIDTRGDEVRIGSTKSLFRTAPGEATALNTSAPAPDSRRILAIEFEETPSAPVLNVLVNWPALRIRATEHGQ